MGTKPCDVCGLPIKTEATYSENAKRYHYKCWGDFLKKQYKQTNWKKDIHGYCFNCKKDRWLNDKSLCRECAKVARTASGGEEQWPEEGQWIER